MSYTWDEGSVKCRRMGRGYFNCHNEHGFTRRCKWSLLCMETVNDRIILVF